MLLFLHELLQNLLVLFSEWVGGVEISRWVDELDVEDVLDWHLVVLVHAQLSRGYLNPRRYGYLSFFEVTFLFLNFHLFFGKVVPEEILADVVFVFLPLLVELCDFVRDDFVERRRSVGSLPLVFNLGGYPDPLSPENSLGFW